MKEWYVIEKSICKKCHGGIIQDQMWAKFWNEHRDKRNYEEILSDDYLIGWFGEKPPPEEIPCPVCDGSGYIKKEVLLMPILNALQDGLI